MLCRYTASMWVYMYIFYKKLDLLFSDCKYFIFSFNKKVGKKNVTTIPH